MGNRYHIVHHPSHLFLETEGRSNVFGNARRHQMPSKISLVGMINSSATGGRGPASGVECSPMAASCDVEVKSPSP